MSNEEQYLYVTTVGRRSGKPRQIEIWFTEFEGRYYIIAEYPDANWVENICANPDVEVRVGRSVFKATGRVIDPRVEPQLNTTIRELSRQKYGWGDGLVVELAPKKNEGPAHAGPGP